MDSTDENDSEDARCIELETLKAIFPELRRIENSESPYSFELEIPVELAQPLTVAFPPARNAIVDVVSAETSRNGGDAGGVAAGTAAAQPLDSIDVSHLPPISLLISLPDGYPESLPPHVELNTTPEWLSRETLSRLEDDGPRLWEEMGRDMVAYTYIDHIQRGAEEAFGILNADGTLSVDPDHKLAVLDYDIKAKKAAFERETFDCGICLDPKKGTSCHKMIDCGHIFCVKCLVDFYGEAIKSGELLTIRCLAPTCAKERAAKIPKDATGRPTKRAKVFISPSELLQIGLPEEIVKRYVTLKYKTELESDKNTIYCPRQWCNGAARSKRHKKPQGLNLIEIDASDDDDDDNDDNDDVSSNSKNKKASKAKFNAAELLRGTANLFAVPGSGVSRSSQKKKKRL
ncbi:hypothetical protein NQ176_g11077 [Zarea fungicola]|uniref:Uncharacterized protein n=1 Tax=Zarea fungicola TaxID=93591 RepID=A0ACC1MEA1_9HYPO|nr:hypothetical protein NQ176_g11077 [Lecanicillium fungicola]